MIKNIQIQVLPKQLDSQNLLLKLVADKINTKTSSINYIEILKKSIDSRQKEIKINLIINVYINEKFIKKKICTPDYKDVNNAEEIIAKQSFFNKVKGIRSKPITKTSEKERYGSYEGTMQDISWRKGLKLLEKYNLNYDLRIPSWHLIEAIQIVRLIPNVKVIINHAGFPWDRSKTGLKKWKDSLKILSKEPNTFIKLSEFGVKGQEWNYKENEKIILELIDIFSPSRCMFASNFPVSGLKISFNKLYKNYKKIVADFSLDEKQDLFWKTAMYVYNLKKDELKKAAIK